MDSIMEFDHQKNEVLTRKTFYANLRLHGMKNKTKRTLRNATLALLALAFLALLGWLETQAGLPNH